MKKLYLILIILPLMAACAGGSAGPEGSNALTEADLLQKNFTLVSVNGKAFAAKGRMPSIHFGDNMRVTGQVCNRFMGNGSLKDGVLTVPQMASTMMLCADNNLNRLEGEFGAIMREGASISLKDDRLIISKGATTLEYVRSEPEK